MTTHSTFIRHKKKDYLQIHTNKPKHVPAEIQHILKPRTILCPDSPEKQRSLLAFGLLCFVPFVCDRRHFCPPQRGYLLTTKPRVFSGSSRGHPAGRIEDDELKCRRGGKSAYFVGAQVYTSSLKVRSCIAVDCTSVCSARWLCFTIRRPLSA